MQILLFFLSAFYCVVMLILFTSWLGFLQQDFEISSGEKRSSLNVMIIAAIFWPIVLPFAYLELLHRFRTQTRITSSQQKTLNSNVTNSQLC